MSLPPPAYASDVTTDYTPQHRTGSSNLVARSLLHLRTKWQHQREEKCIKEANQKVENLIKEKKQKEEHHIKENQKKLEQPKSSLSSGGAQQTYSMPCEDVSLSTTSVPKHVDQKREVVTQSESQPPKTILGRLVQVRDNIVADHRNYQAWKAGYNEVDFVPSYEEYSWSSQLHQTRREEAETHKQGKMTDELQTWYNGRIAKFERRRLRARNLHRREEPLQVRDKQRSTVKRTYPEGPLQLKEAERKVLEAKYHSLAYQRLASRHHGAGNLQENEEAVAFKEMARELADCVVELYMMDNIDKWQRQGVLNSSQMTKSSTPMRKYSCG